MSLEEERSSCGTADASKPEQAEETNMLILMIVLLLLAIAGAGWGHSRWGYVGWSPVGVILTVLLVLWVTGNLHR
jgi:hypothetical protein